jgi:hypothetical protein
MRTPNLPLRYEMEVTATEVIKRLGYFDDNNGVFIQSVSPVGAESLKCICGTVISNGGSDDTGIVRYKSTEGTQLDANISDTIYALAGLRLKSTHLDATVKLLSLSFLAETQDNFEYLILFNPTVAGTFTYNDEPNSAVQTALGATENTVTGGIAIGGGWISAAQAATESIENSIRLGSAIDGTPDEIVVAVRPLGTQADIQGSLTWRELL